MTKGGFGSKNPKSEIRSPKEIRIPNSETQDCHQGSQRLAGPAFPSQNNPAIKGQQGHHRKMTFKEEGNVVGETSSRMRRAILVGWSLSRPFGTAVSLSGFRGGGYFTRLGGNRQNRISRGLNHSA